jgi:uncharacterized protein with ParB-like and HNH nuclease domain
MLVNELVPKNTPELLEDWFEEEEHLESDRSILSDKERKLFTHPYDFSIRLLKEQVDDGTLVLADDFQRRRIWDDSKASRLIESLLINVPIPVCYFAELEDGSCSVIDGQQRLTAIYRYMNNEFSLASLRIRNDLNGKMFSNLGVSDRRSIEHRSLRCILILKKSDPEILFDVFDRLNVSSVKLNRQELRNSLYKGDLSQLIRELAENETFKKARRAADLDKRMNDYELILRFFAFHFNGSNYQSDLAKFLDDYLRLGQKLSSERIEEHRQVFLKTIGNVYDVFESNSFRRYDCNRQVWNNSLNRAIYDVVMLSFSTLLSSHITSEEKNKILHVFKEMCENPEFQTAITSSPETITHIQSRLNIWYEALESINIPVGRVSIGTVSGIIEQ